VLAPSRLTLQIAGFWPVIDIVDRLVVVRVSRFHVTADAQVNSRAYAHYRQRAQDQDQEQPTHFHNGLG
jgi:ribosomal protein L13